MSSALSAASADRKARLAQLKSLKRKAPDGATDHDSEQQEPTGAAGDNGEEPAAPDPTTTYLSGRNYDPQTKGPRLGFEQAPTGNVLTAEERAAALAEEAAEQKRIEEEKASTAAGLDLFSLRPKKADWDLKRELERRMEESGLNVKMDNAIAKLVRERVEAQKKAATTSADGEVGMEGSALVEATREREKEDEEDSRRERELDAELTAP